MKMKKIFKTLASLAIIFAVAPALVGCSNDDDDEVAAVESITGTYSGTMKASVMGTVCDTPGEFNVSISKEPREDDEVIVVMPECSFENAQMGGKRTIPSLTIREVNVGNINGGYEISSGLSKVELNGVTYSCQIKGTISGNNADIMYNVNPGGMGMNINFTFNGKRK